MILRRILTYLVIGFAIWGVVALGLLVYATSAPAPGEYSAVSSSAQTAASSTPTETPEAGPAQPLTEADRQRVEYYRQRGLSPTLVTPKQPEALPPLPVGWQWYRPLPNEPGDRPPALLFGLPPGASVFGADDWVIVWYLRGSQNRDETAGVGLKMQRGGLCTGGEYLGDTVIAGSPAKMYRGMSRFTGQGGLCWEFSYQGSPWVLIIGGIDPTEWEMAATIANLITPDPTTP